jgi:hypothetical protein
MRVGPNHGLDSRDPNFPRLPPLSSPFSPHPPFLCLCRHGAAIQCVESGVLREPTARGQTHQRRTGLQPRPGRLDALVQEASRSRSHRPRRGGGHCGRGCRWRRRIPQQQEQQLEHRNIAHDWRRRRRPNAPRPQPSRRRAHLHQQRVSPMRRRPLSGATAECSQHNRPTRPPQALRSPVPLGLPTRPDRKGSVPAAVERHHLPERHPLLEHAPDPVCRRPAQRACVRRRRLRWLGRPRRRPPGAAQDKALVRRSSVCYFYFG